MVEAGEVTVTVLGTAFEVSAFDTSSSVLVRVRHGKVRVVAEGDSVVGRRLRTVQQDRASAGALGRTTGEDFGDRIIQFNEAPMTAVVEQLQTLFSVKVELAHEGLKGCALTATFEDEPVDYILRVIADTYRLHPYSRKERPEPTCSMARVVKRPTWLVLAVFLPVMAMAQPILKRTVRVDAQRVRLSEALSLIARDGAFKLSATTLQRSTETVW